MGGRQRLSLGNEREMARRKLDNKGTDWMKTKENLNVNLRGEQANEKNSSPSIYHSGPEREPEREREKEQESLDNEFSSHPIVSEDP